MRIESVLVLALAAGAAYYLLASYTNLTGTTALVGSALVPLATVYIANLFLLPMLKLETIPLPGLPTK